MSFPLTVGAHTFADPPALGRAARADARAGGGLVVDGQSPSRWVGDLVRDGHLDEELAMGLVAGLLRVLEPGPLCEGARLGMLVGRDALGPLIELVLDSRDIVLLLDRDPFEPGRSVEDTLLHTWTRCADASDPDIRARLMCGLRNAGLNELEMRLLVRSGTPAEIREFLPAVVEEGVPAGAANALRAALTRGDDVRAAVLETLDVLPPTEKAPLWDAIGGEE